MNCYGCNFSNRNCPCYPVDDNYVVQGPQEFLVLKVHKVPKENVAHKAPKAQRGTRVSWSDWPSWNGWPHGATWPARCQWRCRPKEETRRWAPKGVREIQDLWVRKATEDQLDQRVTPAWLDPLVKR